MDSAMWRRLVAVCAALGSFSTLSQAQEWPNRPVRIVLPVATGAATDLVGRAVGDQFLANSKQPMILENRPAGGGSQAGDMVARSDPDGYTLFLATAGTVTILPFLAKNLPYDPLKDFTPITTVIELPIVLVVNKDLPVNNIAEFVAYAKANPGKLSFGSSGQGSTHHLAGEYLKSHAGIQMVHIPYRGGGPAMTDLLAGQIPALFATLSTVIPYLEGDRLKVLGNIEAKRSKSLPNVPTIGEQLPGYAVPSSWMGYAGPANMPVSLVSKVNAELVKAINAPNVKAALEKAGFEVVTSTPDEHRAAIQNGLERFRKITADAGIQPQ